MHPRFIPVTIWPSFYRQHFLKHSFGWKLIFRFKSYWNCIAKFKLFLHIAACFDVNCALCGVDNIVQCYKCKEGYQLNSMTGLCERKWRHDCVILWTHSNYELSQWETTLHCNVVSHWLSPYPEGLWHLVRSHGHFQQRCLISEIFVWSYY